MSTRYYNQYGQQIPSQEDYNVGSRSSLGALAIESALVLGAVLGIMQFANKCNVDYFNVSGQNKHITAPAHSTPPSSINSAIDTKVEPKLIETSGINRMVGK